jgi:hypothetical protein
VLHGDRAEKTAASSFCASNVAMRFRTMELDTLTLEPVTDMFSMRFCVDNWIAN